MSAASARSDDALTDRTRSRDREPLDARLAAGAAAAWAAVALLADGGARWPLAVGVVAAAGGVLALVVGGRFRAGPAVALVLFCLAFALLPLAARIAHAGASPLTTLAREEAAVTLELRVTTDPRTLAATGTSGSPRVAVESEALRVTTDARTVATSGQVFVIADAAAWHDVLPGQRLDLEGNLSPDLDGSALSVTLFARASPHLVGRPPWWQRAAGSVRSALRAASRPLPADERGLLPGLIDGDTGGLDPVLAERFRLAGLTHLVAVSGTNCSLLLGAILLVLRRARVRPAMCAVVGVAVLALFVVVARPSPSVLRAALMSLVALASLATGRPRAALPSLAAVTLGLLVWDPTLAGSASFAMSVLATAALLVVAPGWAAALRARRVPPFVAESVAVAAAAHVVTAPVVAAISGRVSLVAIPANVLAEPVVAITTVLGFAAAVLAPGWLIGGEVLAWAAGWPCRWLVAVADFFGGLHGAMLPWPGGADGGFLLLALTLVLWFGAVRAGPRRVLVAAATTSLVVLVPVRAVTSGWPPPGWVFVACDVGQGDALVLNAGDHSAIEVDAGPDPIAIDRCLRDLHVRTIALLALTHFHLDHVEGLPGAVRGRRVLSLLTGPLDAPAYGSEIVHRVAARLGLPVRTPAVGTRLDVGAVRLQVLGPSQAYHGTRSDPNNSSLILRATVDGVSIMLPGDAEIEAQQALVASGQDLRADVLKVPHHGSAYSDPGFLAAVHAQVGVVSVGAHNDYGLPSPVLLNEMARLGVPLLRTDRNGDVAVVAKDARPALVARGSAESTVGLGAAPYRRRSAGTRPVLVALRAPRPGAAGVLSAGGARMAECPRAPSPSATCPIRSHRSSSSSATRNCSSTAPSARSPPLRAASIPTWPRPSVRAGRSRARSCTRSSDHRCSVSPGC